MNLLLLAAASALPAGVVQGTTIPVESFLGLREIVEVRAAPAGRAIVIAVTERDNPRDPMRERLYLWNQQHDLRRLAPNLEEAWQPRWSPDATRVGFLSQRPGDTSDGGGQRSHLWIIEPGGADEPVALAQLPGDIRDFAWAGDSSIIVLTGAAGTGPTAEAATSDSSASVWRVPVAGGPADILWRGAGMVYDVAAAPDGRSVVVVHGADGQADLWVHSLEGGEPRRLTRRPGPERRPVWAPDGASVTFQAPQQPDHPNSQIELFSVPASGGAPRPLTAVFDRTVLEHGPAPDGRLAFSAALGTRTHLFTIEPGGAIAAMTSGAFNYGAFSYIAEDTSLVAVRESAREPQELWRITDGEPTRLTHLNERFDLWRLPRQEIVRWTSPDGLVIEGLLVYPRDYSEGQRYPLLIEPAGGPGRRVRDVLQPYSLFAAHGYAVLAVNFRGSPGYGESFATANPRDLGGGQLRDVISGIEHLSRLGMADVGRLGILGKGYGGEVVELLLGGSQRFEAAVVLAEVADRATSTAAPLLIAEERSGSKFDLFFRSLRWFDRFLKFEGADRVAFRLPDEWSSGPAGWSLKVESANPRGDFFTLQPAGDRFIQVTVVLSPPASGDGNDAVLQLDLDDAVALNGYDAGEIPLTGTITRFFGYPALLLPLGKLAVSEEMTIDLAFPIANEAGEYLLRVSGFEPVRIWVPPAGI